MKYVFKCSIYASIAGIVDIAGHVCALPFRILRGGVPEQVRRVLVIRPDHIGDLLFTTPVFRKLKERYPEAGITLVAGSWARDAVGNNPYIEEIIVYDAPWFDRRHKRIFEFSRFFKLAGQLRRGRFDVGLDPRGDFRHILLMALAGVRFRIGYGITGGSFLLHSVIGYVPSRHQIRHNSAVLEPLGINGDPGCPDLFVSESDEAFADGFYREHGLSEGEKAAVIHPFAGYPAKLWPGERFSALLKKLVAIYGTKVIIIGAFRERPDADAIIQAAGVPAVNVAGKTTLGQAAAIIKRADIFIGSDSGPAHIAAAAGRPAVVIYSGTNDPEIWGPCSRNCVIVRKYVECGLCAKTECGDKRCMDGISVEDVLDGVKRVAPRD